MSACSWRSHAFAPMMARLVAAAGIATDDLMITPLRGPGENISFGRGLAQRAHISDNAAKAADVATTGRT